MGPKNINGYSVLFEKLREERDARKSFIEVEDTKYYFFLLGFIAGIIIGLCIGLLPGC